MFGGFVLRRGRLSRFHRAWNLRPPVSASVRRKILTPIYRKFREICKIGNNYDTFVVV
jgi:hypothetical protein